VGGLVVGAALACASPAWAGVVGQIDKLPQDDTWVAGAGALVRASWDADRSGALDTPGEVAAVPCRAWRALDRGYRRAYGGVFGLRVSYGFVARADSTFVYVGDAALGVAANVQIAADEAMSTCGVVR
jgi:hypothetical protein